MTELESIALLSNTITSALITGSSLALLIILLKKGKRGDKV